MTMSGQQNDALLRRLETLEAKVQGLEDQAAILRLVCRWGPAVDTGSSREAGALWDETGVLESDLSRLHGPSEVTAMVESDGQQALIRQGCAHVQSAPVVTVDGDTGVVTSYSQVFLRSEDEHRIWRVSANRWECRRTPSGWRLTKRVNRVLDGSPEPRDVLVQALDEN
jgi:SnoaL-like domain